MPKYSIVLFVLATLSGCSAPVTLGKQYNEVEMAPVGSDAARLIIYLNQHKSSDTYVNVFIDDDDVGRLHTHTFRMHTVPPGNVTISAEHRAVGETAMKGALIVLSMGVAAIDIKKYNEHFTNVPAEVSVSGGEVYFFRVDRDRVSVMEECDESGDEARLCESYKIETRVRPIPPDLARQEVMSLWEVVDDPDR